MIIPFPLQLAATLQSKIIAGRHIPSHVWSRDW